jgi:hypothetical protein
MVWLALRVLGDCGHIRCTLHESRRARRVNTRPRRSITRLRFSKPRVITVHHPITTPLAIHDVIPQESGEPGARLRRIERLPVHRQSIAMHMATGMLFCPRRAPRSRKVRHGDGEQRRRDRGSGLRRACGTPRGPVLRAHQVEMVAKALEIAGGILLGPVTGVPEVEPCASELILKDCALASKQRERRKARAAVVAAARARERAHTC